MTNEEKGILLKNTIVKLYENEGRSISYIHRLLDIDRHTLSKLIKFWGLKHGNQLKKKKEDFLKSYKEFIISKIKCGWTQKEIYKKLHVGREFYLLILQEDLDIKRAMQLVSFKNKEPQEYIEGEQWVKIFGYENYEVSNYGRVRNKYGIIKQEENTYMYVMLYKNGKRNNLRVHRLVAHAFCDGYSTEKNQVNHKDGNVLNNKSSNLEWVTPSENLIHSYKELNRIHKGGGKINYIILYKNKYKFKTISALARFLGVSPTQAKRYIDTKDDIKKIPK